MPNQTTTALQITLGLFNATPGRGYLSEFIVAFAKGTTLTQLSQTLADHNVFKQGVLGGSQLASNQANALLNNFGLDPQTVAGSLAYEYFMQRINNGDHLGSIVFDAINYLNGSPDAQFADTATLLNKKTIVSEYYAVTLGQGTVDSTLQELQAIVSAVTVDTDVSSPEALDAVIAEGLALANGSNNESPTVGEPINGDDNDNDLNGGDGNDTINGEGGNDTIDGGLGNDIIDGGDGDDTINGGDGDDAIIGGLGDDLIDGGEGDDVIDGGEGDDTIYGGAGNDVINGGDGNDIIDGGEDDDTIYGGAGNDTIHGGTGNDVIGGGAGQDTLYGCDGNDVLIGGTGADVLIGGNGNDVFVFAENDSTAAEMTRIVDFSLANDTLDLVVGSIASDLQQRVDVSTADADGLATDILAGVHNGIVTLTGNDAGSIDTLSEWINVLETANVIVASDTRVLTSDNLSDSTLSALTDITSLTSDLNLVDNSGDSGLLGGLLGTVDDLLSGLLGGVSDGAPGLLDGLLGGLLGSGDTGLVGAVNNLLDGLTGVLNGLLGGVVDINELSLLDGGLLNLDASVLNNLLSVDTSLLSADELLALNLAIGDASLVDTGSLDPDALGTVAFEFDGNTYVVESNDAVDNDTSEVNPVNIIELTGVIGISDLNEIQII